ncbi:MAG: hypothetical protein QGH20_04215 [Candidatus Latescibacteria bacterium]|jgi:hypothetical protein|nr:hypothetical protein [Candidatus Latescibacterota bacterium]
MSDERRIGASRIGRREEQRSRSTLKTVRLGLYALILALVLYWLWRDAGIITRGLTGPPFDMRVVSVQEDTSGVDSGRVDVWVAVVIATTDADTHRVLMPQFQLQTEHGDEYMPYATDRVFGVVGLAIPPLDSVAMNLVFNLPDTAAVTHLQWNE